MTRTMKNYLLHKPIEAIWILFLILVVCLSLIERLCFVVTENELGLANYIVDISILFIFLLGGLILPVLSSYQARKLLKEKSGISKKLLLVKAILVPTAASLIAVCLTSMIVNNIDGGNLILIMPALVMLESGLTALAFIFY